MLRPAQLFSRTLLCAWMAVLLAGLPGASFAQQTTAYRAPESNLQSTLRGPAAGAPAATLSDLDTTDIRALLVPSRQAKISSMVTARVRRIHYKLGERFERGATMVSFDCEVLKASHDSARSELEQYQLTHAANVELRGDGAVSELDLSLSGAKVKQGKAELALARAQLRKCVIKAPFRGRVSGRFVNEFEMVSLGDPLLAVLDDSAFEMNLHLPSRWIESVTAGNRFSVLMDETGKTYQAAVLRISPQIDPTSRTFLVTAELLATSPELRAGMSGSAFFPSLK